MIYHLRLVGEVVLTYCLTSLELLQMFLDLVCSGSGHVGLPAPSCSGGVCSRYFWSRSLGVQYQLSVGQVYLFDSATQSGMSVQCIVFAVTVSQLPDRSANVGL